MGLPSERLERISIFFFNFQWGWQGEGHGWVVVEKRWVSKYEEMINWQGTKSTNFKCVNGGEDPTSKVSKKLIFNDKEVTIANNFGRLLVVNSSDVRTIRRYSAHRKDRGPFLPDGQSGVECANCWDGCFMEGPIAGSGRLYSTTTTYCVRSSTP